jgi:DNA invertase Pin-like site-specific DNA recombinase
MANINTGLRNSKSTKSAAAADNVNEVQPYPNPQMMGWMPPYPQQQMGGWMPPQPGMAQYPNPQMMGWMPPYPQQQIGGWMPLQPGMAQYPNPQMMGWMPQPVMQQQPIIMPPSQKAFNTRGITHSHNDNIPDIIHIQELNDDDDDDDDDDDESVDPESIKANAKSNGKKLMAVAAAAAVEEKEDDDDDEEDVVYIPRSKKLVREFKDKDSKQPKQQKSKQEKPEEQQGNQLANLFDNVLDVNLQQGNPNQSYYAEFGQEYDNINVVVKLIPNDKKYAHFNNERYPEEIYKAVMFNGEEKKLPAKDISNEALETGKVVYEHNQQLAVTGQPISGKAFIYARSSRTNDISIETQRKVCLQYAMTNCLELLPFGFQNDNNVSARNMNNLKYELGFWKDYIPDNSHILIYSVDRLSRNLIKGMQFLDEMAARNIKIHFVTHELVFHSSISAAGRSMIQQELQTAEKFSNIASEKIKTTMKRLREEGHVFGLAPYGYKNVLVNNIRKRIPDNKEQDNIKIINSQYTYIMNNWKNNPETTQLRYSNICILRILSRWCNRTGLKNRKRTNYSISQIKNIIQI